MLLLLRKATYLRIRTVVDVPRCAWTNISVLFIPNSGVFDPVPVLFEMPRSSVLLSDVSQISGKNRNEATRSDSCRDAATEQPELSKLTTDDRTQKKNPHMENGEGFVFLTLYCHSSI